jgi:hypothetical protein
VCAFIFLLHFYSKNLTFRMMVLTCVSSSWWVKRKSYPCKRPWRPIGLWEIDAPTFCRQSTHGWRWGFQPYAPAALYSPGRCMVLISVRGSVDPRAIMRLEVLGKLIEQWPHRESNSRSSGLWHTAVGEYSVTVRFSTLKVDVAFSSDTMIICVQVY